MTNNKPFDNCYETLPLACVLISDEYRIKYINPAMVDLLCPAGSQDLLDKSLLDLIAPEDHRKFFDWFDKLDQPAENQPWEILRIPREDSGQQYLLMTGNKETDQQVKCSYLLVGVPYHQSHIEGAHTDHMVQELPKQGTQDQYELLFNKAKIGIAVLNESGVIEESNHAFTEHIGINNVDILHQEYRDILCNQLSRKLHRLINNLNKSRQPYVKDVIAIKTSDREQRIIEISLSDLFNENDNSKKVLLFTEDITNQQDTHIAMLQSEKLALTGRLAASLAHEINNPLQTSLGCLGLIEEMLEENDENDLAVYINLAIEELQRSARIVKKLRDLNRTSDLAERSPVNIQEIIEGVLVLTKNHLYDKQIIPVFPYHGPVATTLASKDQIQQVILNLVMNAIDAMPNGGNIYLDIILTNKPKGISIKIRDTGNGIDPAIKTNLFDPFLTTKEDGLGLGLYICKQIIEDHSGSLDFESEPGQGTEFTIWLPGSVSAQEKE